MKINVDIKSQLKQICDRVVKSSTYVTPTFTVGEHVDERIKTRVKDTRQYVMIRNFFDYCISNLYMEFRLAQKSGFDVIALVLNDKFVFIIKPLWINGEVANGWQVRTFFIKYDDYVFNDKTKVFRYTRRS